MEFVFCKTKSIVVLTFSFQSFRLALMQETASSISRSKHHVALIL